VRTKVAVIASLIALGALGCLAASLVASGASVSPADATTASEPTRTTITEATTQSTSITQTTTTVPTVGKRRIVWTHPVLTLDLTTGWKFLFDDPQTHALIRNERRYDGVYFHALPRSVYDPRKNRGVALHSDFLAWLRQHPFLQVGRIHQLKLGKFVATAIDGRVRRADPDALDQGFCGESNSRGPCVPITVDQNAEGYVGFALDPGEIFRIIKVKTRRRAVVVEIATSGKVHSFIPLAMRLLRTLRSG
jgi:hypothetical protein